mgnify:CR=1 FL=1
MWGWMLSEMMLRTGRQRDSARGARSERFSREAMADPAPDVRTPPLDAHILSMRHGCANSTPPQTDVMSRKTDDPAYASCSSAISERNVGGAAPDTLASFSRTRLKM